MAKLDFFYEFASTYSYLAAMRIDDLALDYDVDVNWRPFLLGPIFKAQGWADSPFNLFPDKGRYMWRDLERTCEAQGLPLRRPSRFPRNGLLPARIACRYDEDDWLPEFVHQVYRANFAEDREISDPAVIGAILQAVGAPAGALAAAESPEAKAKLRAQTERAQALGIFGAPSFVVGEELFWGNDRLEAALAWARR